MKKRKDLGVTILSWVGGIGLGIVTLYALIRVVWWAALMVGADAARVAMLVEAALLPVVAWAGWYFGRTEARGRLAGIDQAVDKVMGAATKTAGLRVSTVRAMRAPAAAPPAADVELPEPEVFYLPSGGKVIEL